MKIAVIDLGTNTCNLLIANTYGKKFEILHQSKNLVKLGDNKIKSNIISNEATQRVVESLNGHRAVINHYKPDKVKVIATSAIRSAENKIELLEIIGENTGWAARVVTGEKEAELIFKGVLLAFDEVPHRSVILDIGGGSNEMIVASGKHMIWKESFATGMARVINRFELSDPLSPGDIAILGEYFNNEHGVFYSRCRDEQVNHLIGCSGAFDTIADIIDGVDPGAKQRTTQEISLKNFREIYEMLISSSRSERLNMKGMDMVRVDLIVPAVILINQLIEAAGIGRIVQTDFALREGILYEELAYHTDGATEA